MRKIRLGILFLAITALFTMSAFSKTHRIDTVAIDTIEYTLEEDDKLSAELYIDEDGIYNIKVADLYTGSNFIPRIGITLSQGKTEVFHYETNKPLLEDDTFNKDKFNFSACLFEGEYTLEVTNLAKSGPVSFVLETTFAEEENLETFGNNSFENSSPIELRTKYFGTAVMEDDKDFFKFDIPEDGYAYVQMYTPQVKHFTLYDKDKNEIGSIGIEIEEADKVYELKTGLAKGTYYISVSPEDDYTLPLYSIKVEFTAGDEFEKEYNNEKNHATKVESGKEYKANLFGIDDVDIYSFELSEESLVKIDFTDTIASKDGHYSIKLLSGDKEIFFVEECGRVSKELSLEKGTYYLSVVDFDEDTFSSMGYKVQISSDKGFADTNIEIPEKEESEETLPEEPVQFADVSTSDWFYGEVLEAKKLGLIEGVGDNKFNPKGNITLAEVITMAVRVKSTLSGANTEITSSPVGKWYNSYITFAVNSGIIKTDDFDDFERNATRAEVAYIFANVLGDADTSKNTIIPDVNEDTKFCNEIHKLYALGILKGDSDGSFRPNDNITRAETAAILVRVCK